MTDTDFDSVMAVLFSLYPKIGAEMNKETRNVWRMALGTFGADACIRGLRDWAANRTKWPRPSDMRQYLSAQSPKRQVATTPQTDDRAEDDRRQRDETFAVMSQADIEQHKATLLAYDWRVKWAEKLPAKSLAWKAMIVRRVWANVQPREEWPEDVPERPVFPVRGNVGRAMVNATRREHGEPKENH